VCEVLVFTQPTQILILALQWNGERWGGGVVGWATVSTAPNLSHWQLERALRSTRVPRLLAAAAIDDQQVWRKSMDSLKLSPPLLLLLLLHISRSGALTG
jgi:hypothetical protein